MKLLKRTLAICMAVAMIMTMLVKVSAVDSTGTITINTGSNNVNGVTFKAYQIFDATASGEKIAYTINTDFTDFFTKINLTDAYFASESATDDEAYQYVNDNVKNENFVEKLKSYIDSKSEIAKKTVTGNEIEKSYEFTELNYGYYAIIPSGGTTYNVNFTTLSRDATTVYLKGSTPSVDKKVNDAEFTSAQIGDTVTFTVTTSLPNLTGYTEYYFKLTDVMSKGLTYVENSLKVSINGKEIGNTGWNIDSNTADNGTTTLTALSPDLIAHNYISLSDVKFTYEAIVNENAIETNTMTNTATIHYGTTSEVTNGGTSDTANVYTYNLAITKQDADDSNKFLAGAEFSLYAGATVEGATLINLIKLDVTADGTNTYRVALPSESEGVTTTTVVSPTNGQIIIYGLKAGNYQLVETEAPDGYNKLSEPESIEIKAVNSNFTHTITVKNSSATLLPETGGMGTIVFTVVGSIGLLVVLASLMKRKKAEK